MLINLIGGMILLLKLEKPLGPHEKETVVFHLLNGGTRYLKQGYRAHMKNGAVIVSNKKDEQAQLTWNMFISEFLNAKEIHI